MEKATASDSGTKSWRPTPTMKNDGTNTARMQNMESSRAMAVRLHASTTARARETPGSIWVWMFSISTVASSTSTPTASASPPSVMMLMVWPVAHSRTTALSSAKGMFMTTISGAAPVAQEDQHHQAGERRAQQAFDNQAAQRVGDVRRLIELQAYVDIVGHDLLEIRDGGFHAR